MKKWFLVFIIFILFSALPGRVFADYTEYNNWLVECLFTSGGSCKTPVVQQGAYDGNGSHAQFALPDLSTATNITLGYAYTKYSGNWQATFYIGCTKDASDVLTTTQVLPYPSGTFSITLDITKVRACGSNLWIMGGGSREIINLTNGYTFGVTAPAPTPTPTPEPTPTPLPTANQQIPPVDWIQINQSDNPASNFTNATAVGQSYDDPRTNQSEIIFKFDPAWIPSGVSVKRADIVFKMNPPEQSYPENQYTNNVLDVGILPGADNGWNDNATWCTRNGINKWVDANDVICTNNYWQIHGQSTATAGQWRFDINTFNYETGISRLRIGNICTSSGCTYNEQLFLDFLANFANGKGFVLRGRDSNGGNYTTIENISTGIPFYLELNYETEAPGGGTIPVPPDILQPGIIDFTGCGINPICYTQRGFDKLAEWLDYIWTSISDKITYFFDVPTPAELAGQQADLLMAILWEKVPLGYIKPLRDQLLPLDLVDVNTLPNIHIPIYNYNFSTNNKYINYYIDYNFNDTSELNTAFITFRNVIYATLTLFIGWAFIFWVIFIFQYQVKQTIFGK